MLSVEFVTASLSHKRRITLQHQHYSAKISQNHRSGLGLVGGRVRGQPAPCQANPGRSRQLLLSNLGLCSVWWETVHGLEEKEISQLYGQVLCTILYYTRIDREPLPHMPLPLASAARPTPPAPGAVWVHAGSTPQQHQAAANLWGYVWGCA